MGIQMHPCPHCPAEFDSLKSLEHHLKTGHNETLPDEKFRCVTCDEEFMSHMEWLDSRGGARGGGRPAKDATA